MINSDFYGTLQEANDYFSGRLHEYAWSNASVDERPKALRAATRIIDTLNYKGFKAPVWTLLQSKGLSEDPHSDPFIGITGSVSRLSPTLDEIRAAEATQALEFPRGADTSVPEAVRL